MTVDELYWKLHALISDGKKGYEVRVQMGDATCPIEPPAVDDEKRHVTL